MTLTPLVGATPSCQQLNVEMLPQSKQTHVFRLRIFANPLAAPEVIDMKDAGVLAVIFLVAQLLVYGAGHHWNHIQRLVKEHDSPQGNPQLEMYLKSLTPDQMIQAAREYSQYAADKFPADNWAEAVMDVGLTLTFYGTDQGGLTNDRLRVLLQGISNKNENDFFQGSARSTCSATVLGANDR